LGECSQLATTLDEEMIQTFGSMILPPGTNLATEPPRYVPDVCAELGGRWLLRYIRLDQVGVFLGGHAGQHFATPTPYSPEETINRLALPNPLEPRLYVLMLDPSKIIDIRGPRYVRMAAGIEYFLPSGFPKNAIVDPGWEIQVR
jgi:hypothetical protein